MMELSRMDLDNIIQSVLMRILLLLSGFSEIRTFILQRRQLSILPAVGRWVAENVAGVNLVVFYDEG